MQERWATRMGLGDGLGIQGAVQATWESGEQQVQGDDGPHRCKGHSPGSRRGMLGSRGTRASQGHPHLD